MFPGNNGSMARSVIQNGLSKSSSYSKSAYCHSILWFKKKKKKDTLNISGCFESLCVIFSNNTALRFFINQLKKKINLSVNNKKISMLVNNRRSFNVETSGDFCFLWSSVELDISECKAENTRITFTIIKQCSSISKHFCDDEIFRNLRGNEKVTRTRNAISEYELLSYTGYPHQKKKFACYVFCYANTIFNYNILLYFYYYLSSCIKKVFSHKSGISRKLLNFKQPGKIVPVYRAIRRSQTSSKVHFKGVYMSTCHPKWCVN